MADSTHFNTSTRAKKAPANLWMPLFIQALRNSANVRAACQAAGIDRSTAYKARERSKAFAAQWNEALEEAIDTLEASAWMRARDGVKREEPIMYKGSKVGAKVIIEYSDSLMTLLLKAHRPAKYRERIDVDIQDKREKAKAAVDEYMTRTGKSKPEAIEALKSHIPQISELVH